MRTRSTPTGTAALLLLLLSLAVACGDELPTAEPVASAGSLATLEAAPAAVPAPPANLAARAVSSGRIDLSWTDASSNESGFKVWRSTQAPGGTYPVSVVIATRPAGATSYSDLTVSIGQTYRYQMAACNADGCANSALVTVDVPLVPAAPTALSATAVSGQRIDLAWTDASTNESAFLVRRTTRRPDGTYPPYQTIATLRVGSTAYADSSVVPGNVYHYRVAACNVSGCAVSSLPSSGLTVPPAPAPPTGVRARAISPTRVDVSWTDASTNETSFRVQRSTRRANGTFMSFQTIATRPAGSTAFTDNTVVGGTTYRYLVQACRNATCTPSSSVPVTVPAP